MCGVLIKGGMFSFLGCPYRGVIMETVHPILSILVSIEAKGHLHFVDSSPGFSQLYNVDSTTSNARSRILRAWRLALCCNLTSGL